jgi:lysophospholipase L1-like esterase
MGLGIGLGLGIGTRKGGSGRFDPASVPSLVHRLRGEGQTAGSLTTWTAAVGASESGGVPPTAVAGAWNGKTVVQFVASNGQYLTEAGSTYLNGATACTVALMVEPSYGYNSVWYERGTGGLRVQTYYSVHYFTPVAGGAYAYLTTGVTAVAPMAVIWVYNGLGATNADRVKCYIDGIERALTFSGTIPSSLTLAAGTRVGGNPTAPAYGDGPLADLLVFSEAFDSTAVAQLTAYLVDQSIPDLVVGVGDSLTAGSGGTPWATQLYAGSGGRPAGRYVTKVATNGWVIADVVAAGPGSIFPLASARYWKRKILVLAIGTNDVGTYGGSVATALAAVESFIDDARAAGFIVVGSTWLNRDDVNLAITSGEFVIAQAAWKTGLQTLLAAGKLVAIADLQARTNLQDPTNTTYFNADKLHLTTTGYGEMAAGVGAALDALLPKGNSNG